MTQRLTKQLNELKSRGGKGRSAYDVVAILAGTNDLFSQTKIDKMMSALARLHTLCHDMGVARTIIMTLPEFDCK